MTERIAGEIKRLRSEKDAVVMAHNYQIPVIQDLADFVGDSLELARKSREYAESTIVVCGADFMAETAKILNPEKTVLNPRQDNVCPMAEMLDEKLILKAKKQYPKAKVVLYVNSTAAAKALADCCCTSANADKVVNAMKSNQVLFGPDRNLAWFVSQRTDKKIIPIPAQGYCYVHRQISLADVQKAKADYPLAEVIAHPECNPEVQKAADRIESTTGMLRYAKESAKTEFIIATEVGMVYRLRKELGSKNFYPVSENMVCVQQKKIGLNDVLLALQKKQYQIKIPKAISEKAAASLNRMVEIG
jgi:quinolinate synthase